MWKRDDQPEFGTFPLTTAVEFVQALMTQMVTRRCPNITIRSSEPLPNLRSVTGVALMADYPSVVNRLKVICNLHPVKYQQSVSGKVDAGFLADDRQHFRVIFHAEFHDQEPEIPH